MKRQLLMLSATIVGLLVLWLEPQREDAGNIFLGAIAVLSWAFVLTYMARSDWGATAGGRAILRLVACIGLLCTQGMASILTDYSYPLRDWIRPLLLMLIALAVLDLFVTLVRIQRDESTLARAQGGWRG